MRPSQSSPVHVFDKATAAATAADGFNTLFFREASVPFRLRRSAGGCASGESTATAFVSSKPDESSSACSRAARGGASGRSDGAVAGLQLRTHTSSAS